MPALTQFESESKTSSLLAQMLIDPAGAVAADVLLAALAVFLLRIFWPIDSHICSTPPQRIPTGHRHFNPSQGRYDLFLIVPLYELFVAPPPCDSLQLYPAQSLPRGVNITAVSTISQPSNSSCDNWLDRFFLRRVRMDPVPALATLKGWIN